MSQTYRVLILDDDQDDVLALTQKFARSEGASFAVKGATSLEDALTILGDHAIDLITIDFQLTGGTAVEAMRSLADHGHVQPVIIVTGLATPERRQDALEAGAFVTLSKDAINPEALGILGQLAITLDRDGRVPGRLMAIQRGMVTRQDHAAVVNQLAALEAQVADLRTPPITLSEPISTLPLPQGEEVVTAESAPAKPAPLEVSENAPAWERILARFERNPIVYIVIVLLLLVLALLTVMHPELAGLIGLRSGQ